MSSTKKKTPQKKIEMWLPVIFACLVDGECKFFADPAMKSHQECLVKVQTYVESAEKNPMFKAAVGNCLPIRYTDGKDT